MHSFTSANVTESIFGKSFNQVSGAPFVCSVLIKATLTFVSFGMAATLWNVNKLCVFDASTVD